MTTKVEKSITVDVPISTAYNQWTQFEDFPQFMGGVSSVTQLGNNQLHWVAQIAGVKREWDAVILEQIPDQKVAWAATGGATNAGAVYFESLGSQTSVRLSLEYEPEGLVETLGDKLNIVEKQAQSDLEKFKAFIEDAGYASGAWRGTVNAGAGVGTPGVEHAQASQGDSGKAGLSTKAVVAGVAAAAAGVAAAGAVKARSGGDDTPAATESVTPAVPVTPVAPAVPVTPAVPPTGSAVGGLDTSDDLVSRDELDTSDDVLPTPDLPAAGGIDKPSGSL